MRSRSLHTMRRFMCVISSCSDHSRCRRHMHLINYDYFDYRKNPNTPNLSPMPWKKWHRFWDLPCISVVTMLSNHPLYTCTTKQQSLTSAICGVILLVCMCLRTAVMDAIHSCWFNSSDSSSMYSPCTMLDGSSYRKQESNICDFVCRFMTIQGNSEGISEGGNEIQT